jgi:riboflavin synthase
MFTGIIEDLGLVKKIEKEGSNLNLWLEARITPELKIDQSLAHNGVCLTVVEIEGSIYKVTAIEETLIKTNLSTLKVGEEVNLERCMTFGARVDGHMVYGHVDSVGTCIGRKENEGSWLYTIEFPSKYKNLIVEKGSVSLNGTSLTVFNVTQNSFSVAIIPYTFEHTSIKNVQIDSKINLEFDIFGKYVEKHLENR